MNNSNIIISIIIVLAIAAGVTAYGLTNDSNTVFNDLSGFTPGSTGDTGIGNLTNSSGNSGSASSGGSGAGSGTGTGSGSGSGTGSGSGSGGRLRGYLAPRLRRRPYGSCSARLPGPWRHFAGSGRSRHRPQRRWWHRQRATGQPRGGGPPCGWPRRCRDSLGKNGTRLRGCPWPRPRHIPGGCGADATDASSRHRRRRLPDRRQSRPGSCRCG